MKKKILVFLQYIFFAALAAFFVWLSLKGMHSQEWAQLKDALDRANYWLLVPVLGLLLASHWLRALRWKQLIDSMGYNTSRINCFLGVMIGYFVNLGAPRLGEVVKCTILARYEKVPADKLVGTIVAERAFDVVCLVIVFGLTFFFQYDVIHTLTSGKLDALFRTASGQTSYIKILMLLAVAAVLFFIGRWFLNKFSHIGPVGKVRNIIINIWHGLTSVKGVKNKPLFFFYTIGIWCLYLFSTWFGFFAIGATSHLTIIDALSVLAMGSVGMIVSPGGIGAYPLLIQKTVSFYNVPAIPFGLALGWLLWFGQFLSFVLFGTISFILLPRINKKLHYQIIAHEGPADHPNENI
ncbi:lysylphosphatidylglycerol synthase transmembrane domain-containing protein [Puia dinghuensis]|nr:lysylphosphatidylglycerol synthase transmembrane domain-containing protein [Puia dinghuensis]